MDQPQNQPARVAKTLPDQIAEHFMARIFTGELAPGQRLPPDRELAQRLGVDRTSLRMAMQQLSRMGLVRAVRGSGVSVLDYREHAGLDFLAAVFALPQVSLGGAFLLQTLDSWLALVPVIIGQALSHATSDDHREMDALLAKQRALCDARASVAELAQLEVAVQDRVARMLGNLQFLLFTNSSRPLRMRMAQLYFETIDVRDHVELHRVLHRKVLRHPLSSEEFARSYRSALARRTEPLRKRLQAMPMAPSIIEPQAGTAKEMPESPKKRGRHADTRPMDRTPEPSTLGA